MSRVPFEPGWSVADALDRLAPPADEALTGAARSRLHALATHLPASLTRVVYLESWIGQPRPRLDLIVKIDPRDGDALADLVRFAADWSCVRSTHPGQCRVRIPVRCARPPRSAWSGAVPASMALYVTIRRR